MPDAYTLHLLGTAYAECEKRSLCLRLWPYGPVLFAVVERMKAESQEYEVVSEGDGATAADALAAILTDLGVEVPDRPSAERVVDLETAWPGPSAAAAYCRAFAREPLTVLALLESQASGAYSVTRTPESAGTE